jgi:hypothetical protein
MTHAEVTTMTIRSTPMFAARRSRRGTASAAARLAQRLVPLAAVCGGAGCGGEDATLTNPVTSETSAAEPAVPTFGEHVSPIFNQKCVHCHQEGGIGPFRLDDYATARAWGNRIAAATEARVMPPYLMETGGECGSFDEGAALGDEQIATIAAWVVGGAPEGTPTPLTRPAVATLAEARAWTTPRFQPQVQGGELAAFDEYRCFRVELGLDADGWATGFEVAPGNPQLVHHVIAFVVDPEAPALLGNNRETIRALDDESPERDGWPCFAAAGEGITVESVPISWGPGTPAIEYPGGAGIRVRQNRELVVQVHYNMANPGAEGQTDQTTLKLRLADSVERQAVYVLPDPMLESLGTEEPVVLPAGQASVPYTWTRSIAEMMGTTNAPLELISLGAHMHERGRRWTLELDNGGGFECIGRINRWDFNWQRAYDYRLPPQLGDASRLRLTCEYDTRGATEPVLPGWGTRNEMCLSVLLIAFPPGVFF